MAFGKGSNSEFCQTLIGFADVTESIGGSTTPEDLREEFKPVVDGVNELDDTDAPDEIQDDVDTAIVAMKDLFVLFEEYDYDFVDIVLEAEDDLRFTALDDPQIEAAMDRVGDYCGIDDETIEEPPGSTETPEFTEDQAARIWQEVFKVDEQTAKCLAEEIGTDPAALDDFSDPTEEICGKTLLELVTGAG